MNIVIIFINTFIIYNRKGKSIYYYKISNTTFRKQFSFKNNKI